MSWIKTEKASSWLNWLRSRARTAETAPEAPPGSGSLAPDLELHVYVRRRPYRLRFELKARDPGLDLSYADFGSTELRRPPDDYMHELFELIEPFVGGGRRAEGAERAVAEQGVQLCRELLSGELREALWALQGRVRTLQVLSEESWIPWEMLKLTSDRQGRSEGEYLGEAFALTRWRRGTPERRHFPIRDLAVFAPADSELASRQPELDFLLALQSEGRRVAEVATRDEELRRHLAQGEHDALHFIGHTRPHSSGSRVGLGVKALLLEDYDVLTPEALRGELANLGASTPLVFFNACSSAWTVDSLAGLGGWVDAMLEAGVGAFLGAYWATWDAAAKDFAVAFYTHFLGGSPLGDAVRLARLEVRRRYPGDPTWLAFTAYAHPLAVCAEPAAESDLDETSHDLYVQECFALWRLLDRHRPGREQSVYLTRRRSAGGTREELVTRFEDAGNGGSGEVWVTAHVRRSREEHFAVLLSLAGESAGEDARRECGSFQASALDPSSSQAAATFRQVRTGRDLEGDLAAGLAAGVRRLPAVQPLLNALRAAARRAGGVEDEDAGAHWQALGRFHLAGRELGELRLRTLDLLRSRLEVQLLTEANDDAAYTHHAGPALTLLRSTRGRPVTAAEVFGLLRATAAGSSPEPSHEEIGAALRRFLEANQRLLNREVHAQRIELGELFVRPTGRFIPRDAPAPSMRGRQVEISVGASMTEIPDVVAWAEQELLDERRDFTLILGDFGHGKTTLLRYLASTLSRTDDPAAPLPIYLPLREYDPSVSLRTSIESLLAPYFPLTDSLWHGRRWLVLCDGFDELSIVHQERQDWVSLRFTTLLKASRLGNVQVVVSSRPILFLDPELRQDTVGRFDRLELLPFDRAQVESWLVRWSRVNRSVSLADLEQRNLLEVARTPVLLMMIAMIFHQQLVERDGTYRRSTIYRLFFDWTASSGGLREPEDGRKHPVPRDYRRILREIAWHLFCHPEAKSGLLHYEVLLAELRRQFPDHQLDLDPRIFVAHAFREEKPRHIEFLHQSLREYLVAEKFFDAFVSVLDQAVTELKLPYAELLADQPVTHAKARFFRDLLESLGSEDQLRLVAKGRGLYHWPTLLYELVEAAPQRLRAYPTFRFRDGRVEEQETFARSQIVLGNLSLMGLLFELYLSDVTGDYEQVFTSNLQAVSALLRSDRALEPLRDVLCRSFNDLNWQGLSFSKADFDGFQFSGSSFVDTEFSECSFRQTDFARCRIQGSEGGPTFAGCIFRESSVFDASMTDLVIEDCTIEKINIYSEQARNRVTFRRCRFIDSLILGEFYDGCRFEGCVFEKVSAGRAQGKDYAGLDILFMSCIQRLDDGSWHPVESFTDLVANTPVDWQP